MPETPDPEPVQQAQPSRKASQVKTYEFTSELETGNELIDSEHKELIDAINNLLLACGEGKGRGEIRKTLEFLNDYIAYHFSDEEKLQRQYGYPDYENHKRYHEEYKRIVAGILNEFEQGGATVALVSKTNQAIAGWLLNHIKKEDVKVAAHIRSKCQD
ncbi:MAG: hemerythrin family protein [Clostridiales bacterium]|nr:hemerythrin family protein [Clostridiales bacterium]